MNNENKQTNTGRGRGFLKFLGFLAGFLITAGGIMLVLNINPVRAFQDVTGIHFGLNEKGEYNKIGFDEKTTSILTPNGKYTLTSYDTAAATVDVNDPNQLGHKLLIIYYTYTNTSSTEQRPSTEWSEHVKAYQGDKELQAGMQLVGTSGPDATKENISNTDQKKGVTVDALAHFDYDPNNPEPISVKIVDKNDKTVHTITYNITNKNND